MKYIIGCDVPDISYIQHHSNGTLRCSDPSNINHKAGTIFAEEYNPGVASMSLDEIDAIMGEVILMIFIAWSFGLVLSFARHKLF